MTSEHDTPNHIHTYSTEYWQDRTTCLDCGYKRGPYPCGVNNCPAMFNIHEDLRHHVTEDHPGVAPPPWPNSEPEPPPAGVDIFDATAPPAGIQRLPDVVTSMTPDTFKTWLGADGQLFVVYLPDRRSFIIKVPDLHNAFFVAMMQQIRFALGPEVQAVRMTVVTGPPAEIDSDELGTAADAPAWAKPEPIFGPDAEVCRAHHNPGCPTCDEADDNLWMHPRDIPDDTDDLLDDTIVHTEPEPVDALLGDEYRTDNQLHLWAITDDEGTIRFYTAPDHVAATLQHLETAPQGLIRQIRLVSMANRPPAKSFDDLRS